MGSISTSDPESDCSTTYTPSTPPESSIVDLEDNLDPSEKIQPGLPRPHVGGTFMIKSVGSEEVVSLVEGKIVLARPDGRGCYWACIQGDGWLGFRNVVSGRFLGRGGNWKLCCEALQYKEWEWFQVRERSTGTVLIMKHKGILRPVAIRVEKRAEYLAMVENWEVEEKMWEFVEV